MSRPTTLWTSLFALMLAPACQDHVVGTVNNRPVAEIDVPLDGQTFVEGAIFTAAGFVDDDDAQDRLDVTWTSTLGDLCTESQVEPGSTTTCEVTALEGMENLCLTAHDGRHESEHECIELSIVPSDPPTATIVQPVESGVYHSDWPITFEGMLSDTEDDPDTLTASWSSSLDGELAGVDTIPDLEGDILGYGYLSEGVHVVVLTVYDSTERRGQANVTIEVGPPNSAPTCSIIEPSDGAAAPFGTCVTFEGVVEDPDQDPGTLTVFWVSDLDGELAESTPDSDGSVSFTTCDLSYGPHQITLEVLDDVEDTCTTSISYVVGSGPSCEIHSPASGDTYYDGDPITFEAVVTDDGGALSDLGIEWSSSVDGVFDTTPADSYGGVLAVWSGLTVARHAITLTATDADGLIGRCSIAELIVEDCLRAWYEDLDGDGYGDDSTAIETCSPPTGYVTLGGDCDDTVSSVHPGATETCDGVDEDCDGTIDDGVAYYTYYLDDDGDGYGDSTVSAYDCAAPSGYITASGDCDDTDPSINPAAAETCDGVDEDCDGTIDDGVTYTDYWRDSDGDGYGDASAASVNDCLAPTGYVDNSGDCDDGDSSVNPAATEICNGVDDDCDGSVDDGVSYLYYYADSDGDGYGDAADSTYSCTSPAGYVTDSSDCEDADASIHPGATEICNGVDDDCDGSVDDGITYRYYYPDSDGDGYGASSGAVYECSAPAGYSTTSTDCDDSDASVHPSASERCNGDDDDCDGSIDEGLSFQYYYRDSDGDGYGGSSGSTYDCSAPSGYVASSGDCDDYDTSVHPGASESCNGDDDDCDGSVDEGLSTQTYYRDYDGDGYGDASYTQTNCTRPSGYVTNSSDCDDYDASIHPGATESCDGVDEDCDGTIADEPCLTTVYSQDFESGSVFSTSTTGNQTLSDGVEWYDTGLFSTLSDESGHSSSHAMGINHSSSSGYSGALMYYIPVSASSSEDLVVSFWAYARSSTTVEIYRPGASVYSQTVPSRTWTLVSATLASSSSTTSVTLRLGLIASEPSYSYSMKIDDITVEK